MKNTDFKNKPLKVLTTWKRDFVFHFIFLFLPKTFEHGLNTSTTCISFGSGFRYYILVDSTHVMPTYCHCRIISVYKS